MSLYIVNQNIINGTTPTTLLLPTRPQTMLPYTTLPPPAQSIPNDAELEPQRKSVHWGWATFYTMSNVPYCSTMLEEKRSRLWWNSEDLERFKLIQRGDYESGEPKVLDEKRKGAFARLLAVKTVLKIQEEGLEESSGNEPLHPDVAAASLKKINGYTLRCALRRAVSLENELSNVVVEDPIIHQNQNQCNTSALLQEENKIRRASVLVTPLSDMASSSGSPKATIQFSNKRCHNGIPDSDKFSTLSCTREPTGSYLDQKWNFEIDPIIHEALVQPKKKLRATKLMSNVVPGAHHASCKS